MIGAGFHLRKVALAAVLTTAGGALLAGWHTYRSLTTPGPAPSHEGEATVISVFVPDGQPLWATADRLVEQRVISGKTLFVLWGRLTGMDRRVKGGEFSFSTPLTPLEVLRILVSGRNARRLVTIPEGMTLKGVADLLASRGFGPSEGFLCLNEDPEFLSAWGLPPEGLEGYLYPDTYAFSRTMRPVEIVGRMVERFHEVFSPSMQRRAEELGLSVHEAVTLASVIEKETHVPEERSLVAAVFHNRLRLGLPLQSDPTVIYGLEDFDGDLTRRHLQTPMRYNTYATAGLPPGPIANPGFESLLASLNPAPVAYLYFVARGDGRHHFSGSLAEHNRAVGRFQKGRR